MSSNYGKIVSMRFPDDVLAKLQQQAHQSGMSFSKFVRSALENIKISNTLDHEAAKNLFKINADQGRLGNLLLLTLNNLEEVPTDKQDSLIDQIADLEQKIRANQTAIKEIVKQIRL